MQEPSYLRSSTHRLSAVAHLVFAFLVTWGMFPTVVAWVSPPVHSVIKNPYKTMNLIPYKHFSSSDECSLLYSHKKSVSDSYSNHSSLRSIIATTAFLTVSWWCSTIPLMPVLDSNNIGNTNLVAQAKEMASGSGSRVNKDPESLLRYGLPIDNKDVRKLQVVLEDIKYDIGSKRKIAALEGVKKAKSLLSNTGSLSSMKSSCRDASQCDSFIQGMIKELEVPNLSSALKDSQDAAQGSEQERVALDKAYASQTRTVQFLSQLEEQMIPKGYKTPVPDIYSDLPQLQGRATVTMTLKKGTPSESFVVDGQSYSEAKLTMIIDGYAAPVTSGNFVDLIQKSFYNGMEIQRSDGFVIQTGDPSGDSDGYVGTGSKAVGNGPHGERLIPLEIFVKGDKGPFYESTIEDEGRGGQATVLPFSSYGAMGWAREEYEPNSGSSQFFWLLFDSDLTPAGKNVLDGRYPCFGYVVDGADFLSSIKEGDIIVSAKVTKGSENLIQPKA